jgi:hypothetical protein
MSDKNSTQKTLQQKFSDAPAYMKALPIIGFAAGMTYGKIVKKCWGCAFGFGAAGFAVGSIPLVIHLNKLDGVGFDKKNETKNEGAALASTTAPSATVNSIMETLAATSAKNEKQKERFESQKDRIKLAVSSLGEKEQSALLELLQMGKALMEKSQSPQQALTVLSSQSAAIEKKYGADFMRGLSSKMEKLQADFKISPLNGNA